LKEPIFHPHWKTPIRRVLVRRNKATDSVRVEHGNRTAGLYKHLEPDGYAYLEYIPGDVTTEPQLVRLHPLPKSKPTSPEIVRLYKKDTVRDSKDGQCYVIHKFGARGTSLFLSPVTEAIANIGNVSSKISKKRKKEISGKQIVKRLTPVKDERP